MVRAIVLYILAAIIMLIELVLNHYHYQYSYLYYYLLSATTRFYCYANDCDYDYDMYRNSNRIRYVIVIILILLIVIVRLLINVIMILLFDYYIDITTCSIVNDTGNCSIHNRSHNHDNSDSNYIITFCGGGARYFSKQLPRGWGLCFGDSVCSFVLVGLLFCEGDG